MPVQRTPSSPFPSHNRPFNAQNKRSTKLEQPNAKEIESPRLDTDDVAIMFRFESPAPAMSDRVSSSPPSSNVPKLEPIPREQSPKRVSNLREQVNLWFERSVVSGRFFGQRAFSFLKTAATLTLTPLLTPVNCGGKALYNGVKDLATAKNPFSLAFKVLWLPIPVTLWTIAGFLVSPVTMWTVARISYAARVPKLVTAIKMEKLAYAQHLMKDTWRKENTLGIKQLQSLYEASKARDPRILQAVIQYFHATERVIINPVFSFGIPQMSIYSDALLVLQHLPNLRQVVCRNVPIKENRIAGRLDFSGCPHLREIDLFKTKLVEFPKGLDSLPHGCQVNLEENPLAQRDVDRFRRMNPQGPTLLFTGPGGFDGVNVHERYIFNAHGKALTKLNKMVSTADLDQIGLYSILSTIEAYKGNWDQKSWDRLTQNLHRVFSGFNFFNDFKESPKEVVRKAFYVMKNLPEDSQNDAFGHFIDALVESHEFCATRVVTETLSALQRALPEEFIGPGQRESWFTRMFSNFKKAEKVDLSRAEFELAFPEFAKDFLIEINLQSPSFSSSQRCTEFQKNIGQKIHKAQPNIRNYDRLGKEIFEYYNEAWQLFEELYL